MHGKFNESFVAFAYICTVNMFKSIMLILGVAFLFVGNIGVDVFKHICQKDGVTISYFVPDNEHCGEKKAELPSCCQKKEEKSHCSSMESLRKKDCCDEEVAHFQVKLDFFQKVKVFTPIAVAVLTPAPFVQNEDVLNTDLVVDNYVNPPPKESGGRDVLIKKRVLII